MRDYIFSNQCIRMRMQNDRDSSTLFYFCDTLSLRHSKYLFTKMQNRNGFGGIAYFTQDIGLKEKLFISRVIIY